MMSEAVNFRPDPGDRGVIFEGQDFRTALKLVAAGLGVALLPALVLADRPESVVALPVRGRQIVRRLFTCRLDTRRVSAPIRYLERYLRESAAAL